MVGLSSALIVPANCPAEQRRVAIARALINDPVLILADEPAGGLGAASGAVVLELLRTSRTATHHHLVAHDRGVADLADRILVIRDGRISSLGSTDS
jgi:putative ABC transport system ATP-binding protein